MSRKKSKLGPHRLAAGIICYRERDDSLLLIRHTRGNHWGIPKGHMDSKDSSEQACALRETREEVGAADIALIPDFREELHYTVPKSKKRRAHPKTVVHFLAFWPDDAEPVLSFEHDAFLFAKEEQLEALLPFEGLCPILRKALAAAREKMQEKA